MSTDRETRLWRAWLETPDGSRYEPHWDDDSNRERAERGRSWVAGYLAGGAEVDRLRSIIDLITGPPPTAEEAEAALDNPGDLSELPRAERQAMGALDIKALVAWALDPAHMSPEEALRRMIAAAEGCDGFDPGAMAEARACLEKRRFEMPPKAVGRPSDVSDVLVRAVAETRDVAEAERAGERIDPDTMGFRMKGGA
jgi:hypothetical protein